MAFVLILPSRLGIQHHLRLSLSACEQVNSCGRGGLVSCSILNSSYGLHPLGTACEVMILQGPQIP